MALKVTLWHILISMLLTLNGHAQAQETPNGPVILTVSGAISAENIEHIAEVDSDVTNIAHFDLALLEELGLFEVTTETPWTVGLIKFEGVLARDLMNHLEFEGSTVKAAALDDYTVNIPIEDFFSHDVIIASRINGKAMRVRENGPLWIIYPWTDNSKLKTTQIFARSIWQLQSLIVVK